jgi:flagellar biosynthesis protein FlhG
MDQAEQLRELVKTIENGKQKPELNSKNARIIAVTSGKGGVGKTSVTVNMAANMAKDGKRVLIIDADLGLSNVEILLGMTPSSTLRDLIRNKKEINDIIINGPFEIDFISGGNGFLELAELSEIEIEEIIVKFQALDDLYDIIIIDTGAGISKNVISFLQISDDVLVVTTPEPTAMTDAYSIIKILNEKKENAKIGLIINRVKTGEEYRHASNILTSTAKKFLKKDIRDMGYVMEDSVVRDTIFKKVPFVLYYPESKASMCVKNLTAKFTGDEIEKRAGIIDKLRGWFR